MPVNTINAWIAKERELGCTKPERIVLATVGKEGIAHSRIVAIRELTEQGILFFTQQGTRKTQEIEYNPKASMTLWLALQQREVMIEGQLKALTQKENEYFWSKKPKESQLRMSAYAPTSGQALSSLSELEKNYQALACLYQHREVPMSEYYCGYRLVPASFIFFTLNDSGFSEVIKYVSDEGAWASQLLSP